MGCMYRLPRLIPSATESEPINRPSAEESEIFSGSLPPVRTPVWRWGGITERYTWRTIGLRKAEIGAQFSAGAPTRRIGRRRWKKRERQREEQLDRAAVDSADFSSVQCSVWSRRSCGVVVLWFVRCLRNFYFVTTCIRSSLSRLFVAVANFADSD